MKVTAILSTLGKVDINPMLTSLCDQSYQIYQLIIVDQGRSDNIEMLCNKYTDRLNIIYAKSFELGASRGRNTGLSIATGDAVIFPDDDAYYDSSFVAELVKAVGETYGFASGKILTRPGGETGRLPIKLNCCQPITKANLLKASIEAAILIRLEALGAERFNPLLGVGSGTAAGSDEGADLLIRLLRKGVKGIFTPTAIAYHPDKVENVDQVVLSRARSYAIGRGYLLKCYWFGFKVTLGELVRPVLGIIFYLLSGDIKRAHYYYNVSVGKWRGLFLRLDK